MSPSFTLSPPFRFCLGETKKKEEYVGNGETWGRVIPTLRQEEETPAVPPKYKYTAAGYIFYTFSMPT